MSYQAEQVLEDNLVNHLQKGSVFEKAKILHDKINLLRDDGTSDYIDFLNTSQWCQNEYQVTQQVTIEWVYKNHYDVTPPLSMAYLSFRYNSNRRGPELKEAFNQIQRYENTLLVQIVNSLTWVKISYDRRIHRNSQTLHSLC